MANEIQLTVEIGTLAPKATGETRQQFAEAIAERLLVYLPTSNSTFTIGGSAPTSDEGPWFKETLDSKSGDNTYTLYVWSSSAAAYVPLFLEQTSLRYFVGNATPSENVYDVWVKTASDGEPLGVLTYNTSSSAWEPVSYTPTELDAFFEGEDSGKKQVDWARITNKPANASNLPRNVSTALVAGDELYDWEQVYHTGIGQMLIFDPISASWKTLSGGVGDLKEVVGSTLGTTGDFTGGIFSTILGKNPGWDLDSSSQGRVVVGADPTDVWDATTTNKKDAGSVHGVDSASLTVGQIPAGLAVDIPTTLDINGGGPVANGFMVGDTGSSKSTASLSDPDANSDVVSRVQKSIAYYRIRKIF